MSLFNFNIRKYFSYPFFEEDEEKFHSMLRNLVWVCIIGAIFILLNVRAVRSISGRLASIFFLCGAVGMLLLLRKNKTYLVAFLLPSTIYLIVLYRAWTGDGVFDFSIALFPLVILMGGVMLGKGGGLLYFGLSWLAIIILVFAQIRGLIATYINIEVDFGDSMILGAILFAQMGLVWMLMERLIESMEQTKNNQEILDERNEQLNRLNKELESRVIERTAELESFSYSVSHDLRAPLRAIDGFSRILLDEYTDQMPEEAQQYQQRVLENASRMSILIDDLLEFSRLGRREIKKQTVNPNVLINEVWQDLVAADSGREVTLTQQDLPHCLADPVLLRQVFANLLGNAFKFTRDRSPAKIEVGTQVVNSETQFYVRDNGVGFNMEYANKLFAVFQRLHNLTEFEGSGIGLATCQRIITQHGGRIWVEAELDKGATFFFTLPE